MSIITPTRNRARFLPHALACVQSQTWPRIEWLVDDDSPAPDPFMQAVADPRLRYCHSPERRTIGAKRNRLIVQAQGDIIAHFDDDDFYSPDYIAHLVQVLQHSEADFAKLTGWFAYSPVYDRLAYCDLENIGGLHWAWSGGPMRRQEFGEAATRRSPSDDYLSFGFSYVFRRSVWQQAPFPEIDWNEDGVFAKAAMKTCRMVFVQDPKGLCMHIVHRSNSSVCYPQYLFPNALFGHLFGVAEGYRRWLWADLAAQA